MGEQKREEKFEQMVAFDSVQRYSWKKTRDDDLGEETREIEFNVDGTYKCTISGWRKKKANAEPNEYSTKEVGRYSKIARGGIDLFKNNGRFRGTIEFYNDAATILRGHSLFPNGT